MTAQYASLTTTRFDTWELRPVERQLLVGGSPVQVGSRAFDVLVALIERAGRVVSRQELLDAVWRDLVVEENNLSVQIAALRKLLGVGVITTVPGLGYRFSAEPKGTAATRPLAYVGRGSEQPCGATPGNIPDTLPELFGRHDDLRRLIELAEANRLLSVVGTGGIGKTRLAITAARHLRDRHAAGAWVVELAPLSDPALLPAAVAQSLGITLPGQRMPVDELIDAVRESPLLLLLDNCEHLVDSASAFVHALLERTQGVRILTTSQEPLKLTAEKIFRLTTLSLPTSDDLGAARAAGAVALLAHRVAHAIPSFSLTASNRADLVEICRRLDGLPLAIELAAARVPLLGLAGVRSRLAERFSVLTGGARSSMRRHRTLRATLEWSCALLSDDELVAFCRAGVFVGTFGLDQAQQLLDADGRQGDGFLDLFAALVDKSLIMVEGDDPPRYRLLESARAYALESLARSGEFERMQAHHSAVMCSLFETSLAEQWTRPSQDRVQHYLPDLDNCRAAIEWAARHAPDRHIALIGASAWLFIATGQSRECRDYCRQAAERLAPETPPALRARLLHEMCGVAHYRPGKEKQADAEQAVALYRSLGDTMGLYRALGRMAITAALSGNAASGDLATREMQALYDPTWPPLAKWDLLNARDYVANAAKRQEEAESLAAAELALATSIGDVPKTMFAMLARQQCTAARGAYQESAEQAAELVALARHRPYVDRMHVYVANLAVALVLAERVEEALVVAREAAVLDQRNDTLWLSLELFATLAAKRGRLEIAAKALGRSIEANRWREEREPVEQRMVLELTALLQRSMPAERLLACQQEGARLSNEEVARLALAD